MSTDLSDDLSPPDTHERASCHAPHMLSPPGLSGAPVIHEDSNDVLDVVVGARR